MVLIRKPYQNNPDEGVTFTEPSMAQQQFKDECDINTIVNRYKVTGALPNAHDPNTAMYGDFTALPADYLEAQELIMKAGESFAELPSALRKRFDNDPINLLQFLADPANLPESIELGLIEAPEKAPESPVSPAAPVEPEK